MCWCGWPQKLRDVYKMLLEYSSERVIVSDGGYSAEKMQIRNKYMVDNCDLLVAVWDGTNGGTANCVNYANSVKRDLIIIDPKL
jgi:uncharacterized phage-like protein YoqJ